MDQLRGVEILSDRIFSRQILIATALHTQSLFLRWCRTFGMICTRKHGYLVISNMFLTRKRGQNFPRLNYTTSSVVSAARQAGEPGAPLYSHPQKCVHSFDSFTLESHLNHLESKRMIPNITCNKTILWDLVSYFSRLALSWRPARYLFVVLDFTYHPFTFPNGRLMASL